MDKQLGTEYHPRFLDYLKMVQQNDLSVAGALTEPRGNRNQKTLEWPDPFLSLKVVDKKINGIVVRGAKINISGAYASHEMVVMPQSAHVQGRRRLRRSLCHPHRCARVHLCLSVLPLFRGTRRSRRSDELGNPLFGQRETSIVIFDNVFVPWDRVFHCGEYKLLRKIRDPFARPPHDLRRHLQGRIHESDHRRVPNLFRNTKALKTYPILTIRLPRWLCFEKQAGPAAWQPPSRARRNRRDPAFISPDEVMGNVSKLNICNAFWR